MHLLPRDICCPDFAGKLSLKHANTSVHHPESVLPSYVVILTRYKLVIQ